MNDKLKTAEEMIHAYTDSIDGEQALWPSDAIDFAKDYASQSGMRWVKASERMPEKKVITQWFWEDGNSGVTKQDAEWIKTMQNHANGRAVIEWLDETPSTIPNNESTAKEPGNESGLRDALEKLAEQYEGVLFEAFRHYKTLEESVKLVSESEVLKQARAALKGDGWTKVEDGLPENRKDKRYSDTVRCWDGKEMYEDSYDQVRKEWYLEFRKVTHWMYIELPNPPQTK